MKKTIRCFSAAIACALLFSMTACSSPSGANAAASTTPAETEAMETAPVADTTSAVGSSGRELYDISFSWDGLTAGDYVTLGEYENIEYPLQTAEVTEDDIQEVLDQMLASSSLYEHITEGTVKDGDTVNIDYVGRIDGVAFEGGTASDQIATIGVSGYIDGFLESLIGAEVGSTIIADVTFPDNYYEHLAGKDAQFEITINYLQGDPIPAELTDEWVAEYTSGTYTTVDDLKAFLEEQLQLEAEEEADKANKAAVWSTVVDNAEISSFPEGFVEYYFQDQMNLIITYANYSGVTFEDYIARMNVTEDEVNTQLLEYAENAAKSSIVNRAIADIYGISVTEDEYQDYIAELATSYGYTNMETLEKDAGGRLQIEDGMLFDKVIAKVLETAIPVETEAETAEDMTETADETMENETEDDMMETETADETAETETTAEMTEEETTEEAETTAAKTGRN